MKQSLFDALKRYGERDYYPFHMPGHKRNPESGPLSEIYRYDITEIDGFDNLHQPESILRDVQDRAAALYHADKTYLLINGSTSGILSAVSAVAERGRKLLIARNCHRAVYHAAFLNRLEIEYIYPDFIETFGISAGITGLQVEKKIKDIAEQEKRPESEAGMGIAAVVLTSPTYDGILSDVPEIVRTAHRYGIPVIIDQAHGAHFGFHPGFPESAADEGADFVIHSVHKTLPAPTQTALLHCNGAYAQTERLEKYLRIYQSSSPSYLLMAGIDSCMELVEREGERRLEELLCNRKKLVQKLNSLKHIRIYPSIAETGRICDEEPEGFDVGLQEPGKLLISARGTGLGGRRLSDILRVRYHLEMEMSGADYVIAILTMMDRVEGFERLRKALTEIDQGLIAESDKRGEWMPYQKIQPVAVTKMSDAFMAQSIWTSFNEAAGRTAADFVNIYPPGIPVLVPGERVEAEILQMLAAYRNNGYTVQGIRENPGYYIKTVRV